MQERSTFVTVTGWIFIVLSAIGVLQGLLFLFIPFDKMMAQAQLQAPAGRPAPDPALMASIIHGVFFFMLVVQLWVLLSSIGLVLRKGWARISFIIICSIGAFFSSIYVLLGLLGSHMPMNQAANAPPGMADFMHGLMTVMAVMGAIFAVLFLFIIYKLNTAKVAEEFRPQPKE